MREGLSRRLCALAVLAQLLVLPATALAQGAAVKVFTRSLQVEGFTRLEEALANIGAKRAVGHVLAQPDLLRDPAVHALLTAQRTGRLHPDAAALISQDAAVARVLEEIGGPGIRATSPGKTLLKSCTANQAELDACFDLFANIDQAAKMAAGVTPQAQRIAAIDVGSNNVKLTIADVVTGKDGVTLRVLYKNKYAAAFGEGLQETGTIPSKNWDVGMEAMEDFSGVMEQFSVDHTVAVGTSALRRATNGKDFVKAVKKATGIELEVIAGEQEAQYVLSATSRGVPQNKTVVAVDIGGGSAELVFGNAKRIKLARSLEIGNRRLAERFPLSKTPKQSEIDDIDEAIAEALLEVEKPPVATELRATGSAQYADVAQQLGLGSLNPEGQIVLTRSDLQSIFDHLVELPRSKRAKILGGDATEADHAIVELRIFIQAMKRFRIEQMRPLSVNLRHGLLVEGLGVPRGTPIRIEH